jgi:hypothetical protein
MSDICYEIVALLCPILTSVPVETNLGLVHLFWALLSGRFLTYRGAIFPSLADLGLPEEAVRRSEAALAQGQWKYGAPLCQDSF